MGKNNIIFGGWVIEPIVCDKGMSQKLATGFSEAFSHWCGISFEPLLYCGHQLAGGTNHMFICKGKGSDKTKVIAKVILHEAFPEEGCLLGHFSVMSIETLAKDLDLDGGWHIKATSDIEPEILKGMENAQLHGAGYKPLLYCASAVANGLLHLLICEGSLAALQANSLIASVVLHDSAGEKKEWSIKSIDNIIGPVFKGEYADNAEANAAPALRDGQMSHYRPLTREDWAIFEKAIEGLFGVGYRPLAVATHVTDGLMRVFLCEATIINASFEGFLANVYVAQQFNGDIMLEKIARLVEHGQEKV